MNSYSELDAGSDRVANAFIALGSRTRSVTERRPGLYKRAGWDLGLSF